MYCIGLTGNIASGKSTVSAHFIKLGVKVISADDIAKKLTESNQPAFNQIIQHFGDSIRTPSGELNRRQLRQFVFKHPEERQWLENLLHPLIRKEIKREINTCKAPYCLIEIPLLSNRTDYPYLKRVLLVQANPEQQITRLMARDHSSREEALAILATQTIIDKRALADDILMNNGSLEELREKVTRLHAQYSLCH